MNYKYTYERSGNDCWLSDTLELTNDRLIHRFTCTGWSNDNNVIVLINENYTKESWIATVLKYLGSRSLKVSNFPGLASVIGDYFYENTSS